MFRSKRISARESQGISRRNQARRRLLFESLDSRRMLAGLVNVDTTVDGDLSLFGDSSNNHIEVRGTAIPGQLVITGRSGTLLRLDGGLQTFSSLTVNGITDDLYAELGDGADRFELGTAANDTEIGINVTIVNQDDDTNVINNVDIGEDLTVSRTDTASSDLQVLGTIVRGNVVVDNGAGGGGDSKTVITNSEIEGTLTITNADGDDLNLIEGTSIGSALFVRPGDPDLPVIPVVVIDNGDGSSLTSFTLKNDPDGTGHLPPGELGRPTVFGGIQIVNGDPLPPGIEVPPPVAGGTTPDALQTAVDIAVFNQVEVLGHLDIDNFDGHTETIIVDSQIGTDTKVIAPAPDGGYGEAITVNNGDGYDVMLMQNSDAPYGLQIVNAGAAGETWGSQTDIRDSEIGGRESTILGAGNALLFSGDDGDDVFNISDTTAAGTEIDGILSLLLFDGDDSVQIVGLPGTIEIESIDIQGNEGDDSVLISNTEVESMVTVQLHSGVDTLEIREGVEFPDELVGTILLEGGLGADFYHIPGGIPWSSFEVFVA